MVAFFIQQGSSQFPINHFPLIFHWFLKNVDILKTHGLLKKEKDEVARALKKESSENQLAQERVERLYRDRYQLRSKLDALIEKIESIE